ncbi:MAG TPA: 30S ribosomal protein S18 [Candidatus Syntrophosphaera thermopropionivorans]|jgi:small subunit ribosomal protein S18|uniref:30S ribosomal protein S18 n=1 Tax=Candidatus Syntrophosphaera thermopropionivorans TaxID=2593015 RepID=A0AC61QJD0_9BACT|nr:30S ribosomal protein S18 [Candidatus Syntrophosphaera thermopropionivorans]MBP7932539.1 30S ribosomal protein S18 [Candidatus Syntrophosphaera sp.]TDF73168.1 30S ribosomal protein S18 [Candidatus Syntrophosphaera thermopropionivorans]HNU97546.1 30S ribosomal protein S18 [Candidatus Syntrophosphaera thermopropionivorans]HOH81838.1 30S ribosomal protein S18 [Candidatus Syntrophosphaera thermopropionivorans]HOJ41809.1 30S ribosomal protein S18 [Candidatus Syntrophosphaera thermopropionivorans
MNTMDRKKKPAHKKYCRFCANKDLVIDYKNVELLSQFISDVGKIESSRLTGTCAKHQRKLSQEIKRARQMALLPYVIE